MRTTAAPSCQNAVAPKDQEENAIQSHTKCHVTANNTVAKKILRPSRAPTLMSPIP